MLAQIIKIQQRLCRLHSPHANHIVAYFVQTRYDDIVIRRCGVRQQLLELLSQTIFRIIIECHVFSSARTFCDSVNQKAKFLLIHVMLKSLESTYCWWRSTGKNSRNEFATHRENCVRESERKKSPKNCIRCWIISTRHILDLDLKLRTRTYTSRWKGQKIKPFSVLMLSLLLLQLMMMMCFHFGVYAEQIFMAEEWVSWFFLSVSSETHTHARAVRILCKNSSSAAANNKQSAADVLRFVLQ